jgi:hypothetical protein
MTANDPTETLHHIARLRAPGHLIWIFGVPLNLNAILRTWFNSGVLALALNRKPVQIGHMSANHDALACCRKAANYRMSRYFNRQPLRQR